MNKIYRYQSLLGTDVSIEITADAADAEILQAGQQGFNAIKEVQDHLSFHDHNSELSKINRQAFEQPVKLSSITWQVLSFAQALSELTEGIFDVTIAPWLLIKHKLPNHSNFQAKEVNFRHLRLNKDIIQFKKPLLIDLGGIAKGFAIDMALDVIRTRLGKNLQQATVKAGEDIKFHNWKQAEVKIADANNRLHQQPMKAAAIATSLAHQSGVSKVDIFNPHTGKVQPMPHSVSVFADSCMVADALTKVAAIAGTTHPVINQLNAQAERH